MAILSKNSKDYIAATSSLIKPGYNSQYGDQITNLVNQIINRGDFNYDFNNDPAYQQYKQQYVTLGKQAVGNAVAATGALTGGYGNSYGATAASQANQQYLTEMNQMIPTLMDAAQKRYQLEQENLQSQFGALESAEALKYGQYRDEVSDYNKDLSFLQNGYSSALNQENKETTRDYQAERDAVSDKQWKDKMAYNAARDAVSDARWQENLDYKRQRAQVSDDQWQKEFDLKQLKAKKSGSGGRGRKNKSSNEYTETWMTQKDADLAISTLQWMKDEKKAKKFVTALVNDGTISAADGNWLGQYWKENIKDTPAPITKGTTPTDILKLTASDAAKAIAFKKQKGSGTRVETKNGFKTTYVDGKIVKREKVR